MASSTGCPLDWVIEFTRRFCELTGIESLHLEEKHSSIYRELFIYHTPKPYPGFRVYFFLWQDQTQIELSPRGQTRDDEFLCYENKNFRLLDLDAAVRKAAWIAMRYGEGYDD